MKTNELQKIKQRFGIIGNAPALDHAIEVAARVANTNMSILILGENGSGKESFARIIHYLSTRKHGSFIAVNCGAIPEGTIESELFGHEKGSFTSAADTRKGYFEESDEGSIFLDEIGEMPLHTQPRLLRVLENKEYMRVGSSQKRSTNTRIITATNVDLQQQIATKKFREDLYYRIAQVIIRIPPLRERNEDIHLLFRKFALDFAQTHQTQRMQLSPEAKELLLAYSFPGNVRQLKNIVLQLGTLETSSIITPATLAQYLPVPPTPVPIEVNTHKSRHTARETFYKIIFDMQQEIQAIKKVLFEFIQHKKSNQTILKQHSQLFQVASDTDASNQQLSALPAPIKHQEETRTHKESLSLEENEERLIRKAIAQTLNYKAAAKVLGISQRTLFRKIQKYNINK